MIHASRVAGGWCRFCERVASWLVTTEAGDVLMCTKCFVARATREDEQRRAEDPE